MILHIPIRDWGANLAVIMAFDLGVKPQPGRQRARKQRPRYSRHSGPQMWLKLNLPEKAPSLLKGAALVRVDLGTRGLILLD